MSIRSAALAVSILLACTSEEAGGTNQSAGGAGGTGGTGTGSVSGAGASGGSGGGIIQTGPSTGSQMPEQDGGTGPGECFNCYGAAGTCTPVNDACLADAGCEAWSDCAKSCYVTDWSVACYEACNSAHPDAEPLWAAVYECVCNYCSVPCQQQCDAAPPK